MSETDWREQLTAKVRTLQIIIAALAFGCFMFLIVALVEGIDGNNAAGQSFLTYLGLAAAVTALILRIFIPGIIVSQGRSAINQKMPSTSQAPSELPINRKIEQENEMASALMGLFITKTIVAGALLEGATFFLLIIFMVERSPLTVLVAVGMMILLVGQIPAVGRTTIWVENQMRLIDQRRAFG
jgi:hypothetical protein